MFKEIGRIPYTRKVKEDFKLNKLWKTWAEKYPEIFDSQDVEIAKNQAIQGYHFHEWFAAVMLFHSLGYLSLVEQYGFRSHTRKQDILKKLVPPSDFEILQNTPGKTQNPGLLVYERDFSDWFFCEVKGPGDRLRKPQIQFFQELEKQTGKEVVTAKLYEI